MAQPRKSKQSDAAQRPNEDVLHPRKTMVLYGHGKTQSAFLNAFYAGSLHHAWLLTGERGIGKATFAYNASRFLLSRSDPGLPVKPETLGIPPEHTVTRQIAAGAHPSLFVLGNEGAAGESSAIGVEAARKLRGFLSLTSTNGWRAVIVDAANDLTSSSANALLKAIEEPPPLTVFFLVSHGSGSILPTIRSRCIRMTLQPLDAYDIENAINAACVSAAIPIPDRNTLAELTANSSGSPGQALAFLSGGLLQLAEKLDRILALLPKFDGTAMHDLVQSALGSKNLGTFARLCDLIEERIEGKARQDGLAADSLRSAGRWASLWEKFREQRLELETLNLDKGAFLIAAFSDIERVARESSRAHFS